MRDLRPLEGLERLRVGDVFARERRERGELAPASFARRFRDRGIDVVGEEQERRALVVLLAHEEKRRREREQHDRQGYAVRVRRQSVAHRAVPHLVVILCGDDEPLGRGTRQLVHEAVQRPEGLVVAVVLARQEDVQLVMEAVEPHRVVAPLLERAEVVGAHLARHEPVDPLAQLAQHVDGRVVVDRVDRVESQPVDAVVARPHDRVADRPFAHAALRVVDRGSPEGVVAVGEVRAEGADRLRAGADVVVDDVEDHAQPGAVRSVDEAREPLGTTVSGVRRVGIHPVVAPAAFAGERRDGHQLDRRDAELSQPDEVRDRRVERPRARERADVELVEHELVERERRPGCDLEARGVDDAGRLPHPARLRA